MANTGEMMDEERVTEQLRELRRKRAAEGAERPVPPGQDRLVLYDDGPLGPEEEWRFGWVDGRHVALNPPPQIVRMSVELVDGSLDMPAALVHGPVTRRGRVVRIVVTNCRAVYRVAAWDVGNATYVCRHARTFAYFPVPSPSPGCE